MANIAAYIGQILTESRGEGVRDAIVEALQAINDQGTGNASSLDGHEASYYATFNQLKQLYGEDKELHLYPEQFDSNGVYSFEKAYPGNKYDLYFQLGPTTTLTEMGQARAAMFVIASKTENKIKALGSIPTVTIPLMVRVVKK